MGPRTILVVLVAGSLLAGVSSAQTKPDLSVVKLKNAAAADVAKALTAFADQKKLPVTVMAEPTTNAVLLAGNADAVKQVMTTLTKLDEPAPTVLVSTQLLSVPAEFVEQIGLAEPSDVQANAWVLTAREVRMLTAATRNAKDQGTIEVLARPSLMVQDNQTAFFEVTNPSAATVRVTPRLGPDAILVRSEIQVAAGGNLQSVETTTKVSDGGTVVIRGPRSKTAEKGSREVLVVLTANRVNSSSK